MQPGATPNWIFPVIPSAQNSVYNAFTFIWEMWRPVYWQANGVVPEIEQNMSIANLPKYSNGNKTADDHDEEQLQVVGRQAHHR